MPLAAKSRAAGKSAASATTGPGALRDALGTNDLIAPGQADGQSSMDAFREELERISQSPRRPFAPSSLPRQVTSSSHAAGAGIVRPRSGKFQLASGGPAVAESPSVGSYGMWDSYFEPEYVGPDDDDDVAEAYEDYFSQQGMSQDDIDDIRSRGSWLDVHNNTPVTAGAVSNIGQNPFISSGVTLDDLTRDFDEDMKLLAETGNFREPSNLPEYDNRTMPGGIRDVDDGMTFDYDHLTADRATGAAMQQYGDLGMGGRDWWEYSPYSIYTKSDEAQQHGFRPYLPDETARFNSTVSNILDEPSDLVGALASSRELMTDYTMGYDRGEGMEPLSLSGSDWDYRAKPYMDNMRRLIAQDQSQFLSMPEGGQVHGAPVSTLILEHEIEDEDGNTRYLYGGISDGSFDVILTYSDGSEVRVPQSEIGVDEEGYLTVPDEYDGDIVDSRMDDSLHLTFNDGQEIYVPESVYGQSDEWHDENGDLIVPETGYIPVDEARGQLPADLVALNADAVERGSIAGAPVLYMPDMVMSDGTRVNWNQAQDIYYDDDVENDPNDPNDDAISYDFGLLNHAKPRRLTGEIIDDNGLNWADLLNNAWDYTMGSLPIMVNPIAWPISVSQGLSKSMAGIDPNKYDALTQSDSYIRAEVDDQGNIVPTYSDLEQVANTAGNMLVPLTEQIVGPIGGDNPMIEKLSGKLPSNPTVGQVWRSFGAGALGEGLEEIGGNLFEEATNQGPMMFGDVVTPEGERLLDDWGNPVVDENGEYRFKDANGRPYEYMTDDTGHIYKSADTPFARRIANFLNPEDLANAFLGGVLVDAALQLPSQTIPASVGAYHNDKIRRDTGVRQYVDTDRDLLRREAAERGEEFDPRIGDIKIDPESFRLFDNEVREYEV